jgi:hypothetical protein
MLLQQAGQIINDSPNSATATDLFEFDSLFAQDIIERTGFPLQEGDQLPLFLDGQSLGASQALTEMTNFVGIESFLLPAGLDDRLEGIAGAGYGAGNGENGAARGAGGTSEAGEAGQGGDVGLPPGEVWW